MRRGEFSAAPIGVRNQRLHNWALALAQGDTRVDLVDFQELRSVADREGLLGVGLSLLPEDVPEEIRQLQKDEFLRNAQYLALLQAVCRELSDRGVECLVLKGAALLFSVYKLGQRPLSDVDLVVRAEHYELAQEVVREVRGAKPQLSGYTVDLHTDPAGRVGPAFHFDLEHLWQRAIPLGPDYPGASMLCPVDQFLHLAVHGLKHSFERLIWVFDLALVFPQVNYPELLAEARATGTVRPAAYALHLLEVLFGTPQGPGLPRLHPAERWFLNRVRLRTAPLWSGKAVVLFSIPGLWPRLRYLWNLCFGPLAFAGPPSVGKAWNRIKARFG